jgi:NAD(P)H-hydrate epimerase
LWRKWAVFYFGGRVLPLVSAQTMREIDVQATRQFGIASLTLMENAGRSVVEEIETHWGSLAGRSLLIVAGKGNNGGDGFVAARYALQRQAFVTVLLIGSGRDVRGDAKANYESLKRTKDDRLTILRSFRRKEFSRRGFDFIVDAIFGTSFHGAVRGEYKRIIDWLGTRRTSKIIAVDIPSGLDATTGERSNAVVRADLTVTMAFPKIGLYLGKGRQYTGMVSVADIHIPRALAKKKSSETFLVEERDVREGLPVRPLDAHKHSVGKIFVLAGSKGLTGAALLCSQSAMKSGAGAVVLGIPATVFPAVARRTLEVMPFALPATSEGSLALPGFDDVVKKIRWADVLLLGPGISQYPETQDLVRRIIATCNKPMVIDADGLNALAADCRILNRRKGRHVILTPHLGEFSRLTGISPGEIEKNRIELARVFAQKNNVVIVLKGAPTIVVDPKGKVFVNSTGNPGMATAGSGDVLAGIIAALLGQGNGPLHAAINGVFVHGYAGDIVRGKIGEMGMLASDILREIPAALKELAKGRERH